MITTKENKVNVLQLICTLGVGGAEKLLIDQLKASKHAELPVNFTIVVMNDLIDKNLKDDLLSVGYSVYFFNRIKGDKNPGYILKLSDIVKKHNIKVIHTHDSGSKTCSILLKLLHPGLKLAHTLHDTNIVNNMNKIKLFIHKSFIDSSIAISKSVYEECNQNKICKAAQIYNGINIKKFLHNKDYSAKKPDILSIINVSRINHAKKGQDVLIKALKECKYRGLRFKCSFVGGVYSYNKDSYDYLTELINDFGLQEEITFLGNRNNVHELLRNSDLFVLPSRYEGFGLVVLEAMASKVAVIASNIDGPAELITNGYNGFLFKNEDYMDLADKIMDVYFNWDQMTPIIQNGLKFVQDFDISFMSEKYYELYKNLAYSDKNISTLNLNK